jgi:serine/threonine protein kinase
LLADAGDASLAAQPKPAAAGNLIALALQLARALAGIHRRGVMHRDITPANIVLSRSGVPCLADFALATSLEAPAKAAACDGPGTARHR